jgi:hypothetical protein
VATEEVRKRRGGCACQTETVEVRETRREQTLDGEIETLDVVSA